MKSDDVKFTVIIPTRERADTLIHCLRTVVAQDYLNLTILVSDNFSQDGTQEAVASFSDRRIRYINTGKRISMAHNWEFALGHVKHGWVMFLGDDDGLCPGALRMLNTLIQRHKVEAVCTNRIVFQWPKHFDAAPAGLIELPLRKSVAIRDSRIEAKKVFKGLMHYTDLPWLYNGGAASVDLITRLRDEQGRFFCSQIPDIYSAIALSLGTDKFLYIDMPIAINGASKHSTGTAFMKPPLAAESAPALMFGAEENIPFHDSLILGKSLQIMLYESYLQSWHIHMGAANISLESQLRVAAIRAPKSRLRDTIADCTEMATMNGVRFDRPRFSRAWNIIRNKVFGLYRSYSKLVIAPVEIDAMNVYEAANGSWGIYKFLIKSHVCRHACLIAGVVRRAKRKWGWATG